jgi:alpha-tubulin suppressor-like RCC1 family protein
VLTFGNGMYGQLGHGNTEKQSAPKLVTALQGQAVYLLACGNFHTIAVTNDQQVYFWGKNLYRTVSNNFPQSVRASRLVPIPCPPRVC